MNKREMQQIEKQKQRARQLSEAKRIAERENREGKRYCQIGGSWIPVSVAGIGGMLFSIFLLIVVLKTGIPIDWWICVLGFVIFLAIFLLDKFIPYKPKYYPDNMPDEEEEEGEESPEEES